MSPKNVSHFFLGLNVSADGGAPVNLEFPTWPLGWYAPYLVLFQPGTFKSWLIKMLKMLPS